MPPRHDAVEEITRIVTHEYRGEDEVLVRTFEFQDPESRVELRVFARGAGPDADLRTERERALEAALRELQDDHDDLAARYHNLEAKAVLELVKERLEARGVLAADGTLDIDRLKAMAENAAGN